jgi:hypothetical protein
MIKYVRNLLIAYLPVRKIKFCNIIPL